MKILISAIFAILLMSGCASKYPITYNSTPLGASVICNGIHQGYTPTTLYYEPGSEQKKEGTLRTESCHAAWVSGATENYTYTWDLNKFPNGVTQTLQRPNVDGYEKDAQFALQVQTMNYQARQAKAAESAASSAAYQNFLNLQRNSQLQQQTYQLPNIKN